MRYKSIIDAIGGEMEESLMEDIEEIDTIIAELEISKGTGNLILCVVNSPAYRERIIRTLQRRFLSEVIFVEKGEQIIRNLKSGDFEGSDILIWVMPEEPTEELLNTLNNFRELFYEVKIPNLVFYNQAFSESVIRKAPDFWRYRGNYYEFEEAERGMAFEALETLATPFYYQDKEDLLRRKRINEYLLKKVRDIKIKSDILGELGGISYYSGELDEALEYHEEALKLDEELGIKEGIAANLGSIGIVYRGKGELEKALEYHEMALNLFRELGLKEGIALARGSIGIVYGIKGDFDKALEYFEKALKLHEELRSKNGIATQLGNIGIVYRTKGELGKALEYFERALNLFEDLGFKEGIAVNLESIGIVYRVKGELDKAQECHEKALRIFKDMGNRIGAARILINIGDVFVRKGDKERALDYYREAQLLAEGSSVFEIVSKRLKRLKEGQNAKDTQ
ncbi:MAG: tetratricopeptide repeat protein [Methanophagales archaeon]|nr:tetratricopeptide repeat protein [Methanophagales archaeon]